MPRRLVDFADWFEDGLLRGGDAHTIRIEDHIGENDYTLCAELPGVDPDKDVQVTVDQDVLTIHAERREHQKAKGRSEFRYGRLDRSVRLPSNADSGKISARYDNGVLKVMVPLKSPEPTGRTIEITKGSVSSKAESGPSFKAESGRSGR
jgi:HSP20 family molecular chaperone IbpA